MKKEKKTTKKTEKKEESKKTENQEKEVNNFSRELGKPNTKEQITARFTVDQIVMKNDRIWRVKMTIDEVLPKSYRDYDVKMEVNEDPYNEKIEAVKRDIQDIKNENSLFGELRKERIDELNGKITKIENELSKIKEQCTEIETSASVEEVKYENSVIVLRIPDTVIENLNQQKMNFKHYKIILTPLI